MRYISYLSLLEFKPEQFGACRLRQIVLARAPFRVVPLLRKFCNSRCTHGETKNESMGQT